jgi:Zn-dependent protease
MLFSILSSGGTLGEKLVLLLISVLALLPALSVHEWAHGYAAYKLGDSTARADGRLSLNPLDHLDPLGTLMLLLVGFGWAKPVPVNTRHFKKPRRDFALTSLAGPISNLLLGFISALLYVLAFYVCSALEVSQMTATVIINVFYFSTLYNLGLGLFNLIPLPPLDGSNILICLLPNRLAAKYSKIRYYSSYIFLALVIIRRIPDLAFISEIVFWPVNQGRSLLFELFVEFGDMIFGSLFA